MELYKEKYCNHNIKHTKKIMESHESCNHSTVMTNEEWNHIEHNTILTNKLCNDIKYLQIINNNN